MSIIQCGYYYTCWGISQQNRFLLETIDKSNRRNFRQIVVKDRSLSRICPDTFPLGHTMVSKVPASQLLEHFAIKQNALALAHSPGLKLSGSLTLFWIVRKRFNCQNSVNFSSCLFPLHSPIKSYPRLSASLISHCILFFQICILFSLRSSKTYDLRFRSLDLLQPMLLK